MGHEIEGRLLEVCTCNVPAPLLGRRKPRLRDVRYDDRLGIERVYRGRRCQRAHDRRLCRHPNILIPKSWKAAVFIDDRSTDAQQDELIKLFTGQLGGAVADLAGLIGEVTAVERVPIGFTVEGGKGKLTLGELSRLKTTPYVGLTGNPTTLAETGLQHDPGLPAYAAKASNYRRDGSTHGIPSVKNLEGQTPSRATSASPPSASGSLGRAHPPPGHAAGTGPSAAHRGSWCAVGCCVGLPWLWGQLLTRGSCTDANSERIGKWGGRDALRHRLGRDDRGDDAANQRPLYRHVRRPCRAAAPSGPARRVARRCLCRGLDVVALASTSPTASSTSSSTTPCWSNTPP